jgi:hypothetical protein
LSALCTLVAAEISDKRFILKVLCGLRLDGRVLGSYLRSFILRSSLNSDADLDLNAEKALIPGKPEV